VAERTWRISQDEWQARDGKAFLIVEGCPRQKCCIPLTTGPAVHSGDMKRWHWDGNVEKPTITPSVNCNGQGGCGWHVTITNGVVQ
jgi:hypothetical protein